jgi:hypothetical protein
MLLTLGATKSKPNEYKNQSNDPKRKIPLNLFEMDSIAFQILILYIL